VIVVASVITVLIGVSIVMAQGGKRIENTWAGLTDAQKQAVVDDTHAKNVKYLQDFEAHHGDPRSLPTIKIESFRGPAPSLGGAATEASVIVRGVVQEVHFSIDPQGNSVPQMTATLRVRAVGKGSVAATTILVRQLGGPVAQADHGALLRFDEELMLPGDEVVLLANRVEPNRDEYRAVSGAGVLFVTGGNLVGEAAARYGLKGQQVTTAWKALTDPQISTTAFPLRSGADV
jgi:hypothetical protein